MDMENSKSMNGEHVEDGKNQKKQQLGTLTLPARDAATESFLKVTDGISPMSFVSSLFSDPDSFTGDNSKSPSFSHLLMGSGASDGLPTGLQQHQPSLSRNTTENESRDNNNGGGSQQNPGSAKYRSMVPPSIPIPSSPFMLPQGFSPTNLLDSPVFFSFNQAEPSPTTGFPCFPSHDAEMKSTPESTNNTVDKITQDGGDSTFSQNDDSSFAFKPPPPLYYSTTFNSEAFQDAYGMSNQQQQQQPLSQIATKQQASTQAVKDQQTSSQVQTQPREQSATMQVSSGSPIDEGKSEPVSEPKEKAAVKRTSSQDYIPPLPHLVEKPSEDGYNWRKYGQKQVRGSEYPRSYYKCTHTGCAVKKIIERSYEGHITEIVYKGKHNHPKPQTTRRSGANNGANAASAAQALERTGSSAFELENSEIARTESGKFAEEPLAAGAAETLASDEEAENGVDDEPEQKRIKLDGSKEYVTNPPLRSIREPRVVVQTTSDVDILDDGYRWRKYGQKVVKGNPYPRSYYKCTNVGCNVRKQVERSSSDKRAVITTYEGKHNHDVPMAKNSGHDPNRPAAAPSRLPDGAWDDKNTKNTVFHDNLPHEDYKLNQGADGSLQQSHTNPSQVLEFKPKAEPTDPPHVYKPQLMS